MYLVAVPLAPNLGSTCQHAISAKKDGVQQGQQQTRLPRATRILPMRMVTIGKDRGGSMQAVADDYIKKIQRYCSFQEIQLRPNPKNSSGMYVKVQLYEHITTSNIYAHSPELVKSTEGDGLVILQATISTEGERVLRFISAKDWVVLLDERGKEVTSEQFADLIADAGETGSTALVFCIGGPYGHGPQVRERANVNVKLSAMSLDDPSRGEISSLTQVHASQEVPSTKGLFFSEFHHHSISHKILGMEYLSPKVPEPPALMSRRVKGLNSLRKKV